MSIYYHLKLLLGLLMCWFWRPLWTKAVVFPPPHFSDCNCIRLNPAWRCFTLFQRSFITKDSTAAFSLKPRSHGSVSRAESFFPVVSCWLCLSQINTLPKRPTLSHTHTHTATRPFCDSPIWSECSLNRTVILNFCAKLSQLWNDFLCQEPG